MAGKTFLPVKETDLDEGALMDRNKRIMFDSLGSNESLLETLEKEMSKLRKQGVLEPNINEVTLPQIMTAQKELNSLSKIPYSLPKEVREGGAKLGLIDLLRNIPEKPVTQRSPREEASITALLVGSVFGAGALGVGGVAYARRRKRKKLEAGSANDSNAREGENL